VDAVTRRFQPHEDLLNLKAPWPGLYQIRSGFACRYTTFPNGRRQIIGLHVPGDFCDPGAALFDRVNYSIGAIRTVDAALIPADMFRTLVTSSLTLIRALWRLTEIDSAIERQWLLNVGQRTALERVAHLLCETFTRLKIAGLTERNECEFPLTQTEIADAMALSQVHVNRTLMQLRRMGMVSLKRQRLEIHDFESLQLLCGFSPDYLQAREPLAAVPVPDEALLVRTRPGLRVAESIDQRTALPSQ
jgi:CRP-like cAMP-binding protein